MKLLRQQEIKKCVGEGVLSKPTIKLTEKGLFTVLFTAKGVTVGVAKTNGTQVHYKSVSGAKSLIKRLTNTKED